MPPHRAGRVLTHDCYGPGGSCTACGRRHLLEAELACLNCLVKNECQWWCPVQRLHHGVWTPSVRTVVVRGGRL